MESHHPTKKELVTAFRTREILAAAHRLMERRGVEQVTMEEIAQAAGVAKGTIYLYFQGKDELMRALLAQVGEAMAADLEAVLALDCSHRDKLAKTVTVLMEYVNRERLLFPIYLRELVQAKASRGSRAQSFQNLEERIIGLITRLFAEGMAAGEFLPGNPRLLAYLLKGLVRAVGYFHLTEGSNGVLPDTVHTVQTLLFSGLLKPGADPPAGGVG